MTTGAVGSPEGVVGWWFGFCRFALGDAGNLIGPAGLDPSQGMSGKSPREEIQCLQRFSPSAHCRSVSPPPRWPNRAQAPDPAALRAPVPREPADPCRARGRAAPVLRRSMAIRLPRLAGQGVVRLIPIRRAAPAIPVVRTAPRTIGLRAAAVPRPILAGLPRPGRRKIADPNSVVAAGGVLPAPPAWFQFLRTVHGTP